VARSVAGILMGYYGCGPGSFLGVMVTSVVSFVYVSCRSRLCVEIQGGLHDTRRAPRPFRATKS